MLSEQGSSLSAQATDGEPVCLSMIPVVHRFKERFNNWDGISLYYKPESSDKSGNGGGGSSWSQDGIPVKGAASGARPLVGSITHMLEIRQVSCACKPPWVL